VLFSIGKWVLERLQDHFLDEDDKEDDKSSPATYVLAHSDWGYPSSMVTLQVLQIHYLNHENFSTLRASCADNLRASGQEIHGHQSMLKSTARRIDELKGHENLSGV
jgi:hypothetical protein